MFEKRDILKEILLKMYYNNGKTLSENTKQIQNKRIINEQVYVKDNGKNTYSLMYGPYDGIPASEIYPEITSGDYPKTFDPDPTKQNVLLYPKALEYFNNYLKGKRQITTPEDRQILPQQFVQSQYEQQNKEFGFGCIGTTFWNPKGRPKGTYVRSREDAGGYWADKQGKPVNYKPTNDQIISRGLQWVSPKPPSGAYEQVNIENIKTYVEMRGVPWGFSPLEWDEYLTQKKEIEKKYDDMIKDVYSKESYSDTSTTQKKDRTNLLGVTQKQVTFLQTRKLAELGTLKSAYYHENYPCGITREDYIRHVQDEKSLDKEMEQKIKVVVDSLNREYENKAEIERQDITRVSNQRIQSMGIIQIGGTKFEIQEKLIRDIKLEYDDMKGYLNLIFSCEPGYLEYVKELDKSKVQRWWEENGWWAELAGWVLLDAFASWVGPLGAPIIASSFPRIASLVEKIGGVMRVLEPGFEYMKSGQQLGLVIKQAINVGTPLAIGAAITEYQGELTTDGLVYFIFAGLPFVHGKLGMNGNFSGQVGMNVIEKMMKADLKTPEGWKIFAKGLSIEEKVWMRKLSQMTPQEATKIYEEILTVIEKNLGKTGIRGAEAAVKTTMLQLAAEELVLRQLISRGRNISLIGKFLGTFAMDITIIKASELLADKLKLIDLDAEERKVNKQEEMFNILNAWMEWSQKNSGDMGKLLLTYKKFKYNLQKLSVEKRSQKLQTIGNYITQSEIFEELKKAAEEAQKLIDSQPSEAKQEILESALNGEFKGILIALVNKNDFLMKEVKSKPKLYSDVKDGIVWTMVDPETSEGHDYYVDKESGKEKIFKIRENMGVENLKLTLPSDTINRNKF